MNSMGLLSRVCQQWLTEPEQIKLPAREAEQLLVAVNSATRSIWAALPVVLKKKPFSVVFYEAISTTRTCTRGSVVTIPVSVSAEALDYCSVQIDDGVYHELRRSGTNYVTLHPYLGTTGSKTITIYRDAAVLPFIVERIMQNLTEVIERIQWGYIPPECRSSFIGNERIYSVESAFIQGATRTVVKLSQRHNALKAFESVAVIRPSELTLVDSQQAAELPYSEDVAQWIIRAAGQWLITHPKFKQDLLKEAIGSQQAAIDHLNSTISTDLITTISGIGPAPGH